MKASRLVGPGQSEIVDIPIPVITDDEVLIEVSVCGVCASELYAWKTGQGSRRPIFGHEPVGNIVDVGRNVSGFRIGDRVTGLIHQAFAEYAKADWRDIVKVSDALDDLEALGEPLSCLVSGADRTPVRPGETVAVVGTGFMGLGFMQLMALRGAGRIVAIDVREEGRRNALRFGADAALHPDRVPEEYFVTEWDHIGRGIPVVVEVTGTQAGLDLASDMTAAHGILSIVGYHQGNGGLRNVNLQRWNWKAMTVVNAHERRNRVHIESMKSALRLIEQGLFRMKDMVTHVYGLEEVDRAYGDLMNKPDGFIKSAIRIR